MELVKIGNQKYTCNLQGPSPFHSQGKFHLQEPSQLFILCCHVVLKKKNRFLEVNSNKRKSMFLDGVPEKNEIATPLDIVNVSQFQKLVQTNFEFLLFVFGFLCEQQNSKKQRFHFVNPCVRNFKKIHRFSKVSNAFQTKFTVRK